MVGVAEAAGADVTELSAALFEGVDTLSGRRLVEFTQYRRVVLPLDGSVFWVRADLLSPSAALGGLALNGSTLSSPPALEQPAATVQARGSLHYATQARQDEDSSAPHNRVVFTSEVEVQDLNAVGPALMYVGDFDGLRFAFSSRGSFFARAALHHYVGDAVYGWMSTQLVDDPSQLAGLDLVVSNSLPAWLAMGLPVPTFPSMLVPQGQLPPYATVHIAEDATRPLQAVPWVDGDSGSSYQLLSDRVRLTLVGLPSYAALDLVARVLASVGVDGDPLGLMNVPVLRDAKRGQVEVQALAQQKVVDFEVSYYQARLRQLAAQYIVACVPRLVTSPGDLAVWNGFDWDGGPLWWADLPSSWGGFDWDGSAPWQ